MDAPLAPTIAQIFLESSALLPLQLKKGGGSYIFFSKCGYRSSLKVM